MLPKLELVYSTPEALRADYESNLRKGRAFVPGASDLSERESCELVIRCSERGAVEVFRAEAVWIGRQDPGAGVGLQLTEFGADARSRLAALVDGVDAAVDRPAIVSAAGPEAEPDPQGEAERASQERAPGNIHQRVRELGTRERDVMARQGTLPERVALERRYGSAVWEGLLQNPQVTVQEVAHIVKSGNVPQPLLSTIAGNGAWVKAPEVQRALLANPRLTGPSLDKLLRALSRRDLQHLVQQPNTRPQVRQAIQRALGAKT